MVNSNDRRPTAASISDYEVGRHYRWEVDAHVEEDLHIRKTGQAWSYDFRNRWFRRYFSITSHVVQYEIIQCPVCADSIAAHRIAGTDPFAPSKDLKEEIYRLNRRIAVAYNYRQLEITPP